MKKELYELNFNEILKSKETIIISENPIANYEYRGFCTDCEDKNLIEEDIQILRKVSHAACLDDYKNVMGNIIETTNISVMFVFQDPNGDDSFTEQISYNNHIKYVPSKTYYWHPCSKKWEISIEEIIKNPYGPYLVYLENMHKFKDMYITNVVKCYYGNHINKCSSNCINKYLLKEIEIFKPDLIFAFSNAVYNMIRYILLDQRVIKLYHPSFMVHRSYTIGMSPKEVIDQNNKIIAENMRLTTAST